MHHGENYRRQFCISDAHRVNEPQAEEEVGRFVTEVEATEAIMEYVKMNDLRFSLISEADLDDRQDRSDSEAATAGSV